MSQTSETANAKLLARTIINIALLTKPSQNFLIQLTIMIKKLKVSPKPVSKWILSKRNPISINWQTLTKRRNEKRKNIPKVNRDELRA